MLWTIATEVLIIIVLITVNGLLSMSEMAIISARKTKLQQLSAQGSVGARIALRLATEPSDFLASIQVGITLIGIFAGAFGGATIAEEFARLLANNSILAPYSEALGLGGVVVIVTIASLLWGELVPKRLALNNPELVATLVAPSIRVISIIARPVVKFLSAATDGILKIAGVTRRDDTALTEEEVKIVIEQGTESGLFEKEEESMIKRVISYGDRKAGELMTHRLKLVCLPLNAPFDENLTKILAAPHSYFPVYDDTIDHLIGVVSAKCILSRIAKGQGNDVNIRTCVVEPLRIAETMPALRVLERFKQSGKHLALVVDEYGNTAGLVTIVDVLEALVGDLPGEKEESQIIIRDDGSYLVDGTFSIYELNDILKIPVTRSEIAGEYQTLGGFVMEKLGHIPKEAENFFWKQYCFEVLDMDGHRVDKVLITVSPTSKSTDAQFDEPNISD
jgi:putative hemolysin